MNGTALVTTMLRTASACLLAGFMSGCATMIHGTTQKVDITSIPSGASAQIEPGAISLTTPATTELSRNEGYTVQFILPGYASKIENIDREVSGAVYGNLLFGGLVGIIIDTVNGAAYNLVPEHLHVELEAVPPSPIDALSGRMPLDDEPSASSPSPDIDGP